MDQHWKHKIETLSEWLGSLKITEEALQASIEYIDKISTALVQEQSRQTELPKIMVLNPGLFNGNRIKLEDW